MRSKKKLSQLFIKISTVCISFIFSTVIANIDTTFGPDLDKAIVVENTPTFTNNTLIRGKVRFRNGFMGNARLRIDTQEPVSGTLNVSNGFGELHLHGDLYLAPGAHLFAGNIFLHGHTIYLQGDLDFRGFVSGGAVTFLGQGTIDGQGHRFILPYPEVLQLVGTGTAPGGQDNDCNITLKNLSFENAQSVNFNGPGQFGGGDRGRLNIDNVSFKIVPNQGLELFFKASQLHFYRNVNYTSTEPGTGVGIDNNLYATGQTYIHSGTTVYSGPAFFFNLKNVFTNPIFEDSSATFHFDNSIFWWSTSSDPLETRLTRGSFIVEGRVLVGRQSNITAFPTLTIGDGNADNDLSVLILPGSTLEIATQQQFAPFGFTELIYANAV